MGIYKSLFGCGSAGELYRRVPETLSQKRRSTVAHPIEMQMYLVVSLGLGMGFATGPDPNMVFGFLSNQTLEAYWLCNTWALQ
jgi:hypothetical protein